MGHDINSAKVICHQLQHRVNDEGRVSFVCEIVKTELSALSSGKQFKFSDVAVLFCSYLSNKYMSALDAMLWQKFGARTQSIEEQLNSNNTKNVIVDDYRNIASFECPMVIVVSTNLGKAFQCYKIYSRAPSKLLVVDIDSHQPLYGYYQHIDYIIWKANENNIFQKL